MAREKIKRYHDKGEYFWEPRKKYQLDEEDAKKVLEDNIEEKIKILKKMKPNEEYPIMTLPSKETNTKPFFDYIESLKEIGLDIDKGNAEYGFNMPWAQNGKKERELIIFRREVQKEKIFRRK